jgi:hypothetical protein
MNGQIVLSRQRLSTAAIIKTLYLDPSLDEVQLVLYAENLGSIPPNSGLMLIKDKRETYEVRFSGDLNKNAAIIFKRKK